MISRKIRDIKENFKGAASLYRLEKPYKEYLFIILSQISKGDKKEIVIFGTDVNINSLIMLDVFITDLSVRDILKKIGYTEVVNELGRLIVP